MRIHIWGGIPTEGRKSNIHNIGILLLKDSSLRYCFVVFALLFCGFCVFLFFVLSSLFIDKFPGFINKNFG